MLTLYIALTSLGIILAIIAVISLLIAISINDGVACLICTVAAILCGLCFWGTYAITEAHTTTETTIVQMEVRELITSQDTNYHIILKNDDMCFNLKINLDEYCQYSVGDIAEVEVTTIKKQLHNTTEQKVGLWR